MAENNGKSVRQINLIARGEPFIWEMGGALMFGIIMIAAFLVLIFFNGAIAFFPKPVYHLTLKDGTSLAGEAVRTEDFSGKEDADLEQTPTGTETDGKKSGSPTRTLYRIGNFDFYNEDFKWVSSTDIAAMKEPAAIYYIERREWGPFIGFIDALKIDETSIPFDDSREKRNVLKREIEKANARRSAIHRIEGKKIGRVNRQLEKERLKLKSIETRHGKESEYFSSALSLYTEKTKALEHQYQDLVSEADDIKKSDERYKALLKEVGGRTREVKLSGIVRLYPPNGLTTTGKTSVYLSRWMEYLTDEPREANTEGGVMPAIFGTFIMTLIMVVFVTPFGVMAALYLREYAKQGKLVSAVRICVNNLSGVPSIVYGVFGLGFFAYVLGGNIDRLFFPERLPNPTFGTGGILWAALTLALLTVPVVIVSAEEALSAVPPSLREGSLACGASKWQTIKYIVLPKAMPGIMTGLILAMARGAGEVAPLMLVGVVKLAPELPVDSIFPFIHLERSFMHLGFHIFDVGFQSRNSEAGKPMVFVTTLLLITLIAAMNASAIFIRNRLKKKYAAGHF